MSEKKEKKVTPIGFAKWAHLQKPKAAFLDEKGKAKGSPKYQIDVCFSVEDPAWKAWASELKNMIAALPSQMDKYTGNEAKKQMPIKRELNEDDQPTGRFFVTFKTGEQFKPNVFDKFGKPLPENILIGNESKVRVSYSPVPYDAFGGGYVLYLNAVQVLELVEYKPASAEAYGFSVEQDAAPAKDPVDELPF